MQNIKKIVHDINVMKSKSDLISEFICSVKQLSEYEPALEITVCRESCGQWLLDEVCEKFGGIQEKDYFGLRYTDKDEQRQWLDLGKNIYAQLKDMHPIVVSFRIKHYPASPIHDLKQNIACYYLYLQLRRDLFSGRLLGKSADLYQLAAYAVQSEVGDFVVQSDDTRYLSDLKLLQNLNSKTEAKIMEIHKTLAGLTPSESEQKFLEKACQLDTYGVEPFYVKDQKGNNLYVGLTHEGVSTFQGSRRAHLFKWSDILKIHYQGKLFIIQVILAEIVNNPQTKRKHVLGFKCATKASAAALWKWANDRMCFFSLNRSSEAKRVKSGGGIFKRRKTFRFSGRCQREIIQMSMSMMQINENPSMGMDRCNTLGRSDISEDEEYNQNKSRYNTMPLRDRDTMLGTRDTLDSLFIPSVHGTMDFTDSQSQSNSLVGSPKSDHKSSYVGSQSLEHITEELHIAPGKTVPCDSVSSVYTSEPKNNSSRKSSTISSRYNLAPNTNIVIRRKLSACDSDIEVVMEQFDNAVDVTDGPSMPKTTVKRSARDYVTKMLCWTSAVIIGLLLLTLFAVLIVILTLNFHDSIKLYGYSSFLSNIISNPGQLIRSQYLSQLASDGYVRLSTFITSNSNNNN